MRWVLIVLVVLVLVALWGAGFFFPDLRWFAELLTALVILPIVGFLVFFWVRARMRQAAEPKPAPLAPEKRPEAVTLRSHFRRAGAELRRVLGGRAGVRRLPWCGALGPPGAGGSAVLDRLGLSLMTVPSAERLQGERAPC